jgi:hypothetical protein
MDLLQLVSQHIFSGPVQVNWVHILIKIRGFKQALKRGVDVACVADVLESSESLHNILVQNMRVEILKFTGLVLNSEVLAFRAFQIQNDTVSKNSTDIALL